MLICLRGGGILGLHNLWIMPLKGKYMVFQIWLMLTEHLQVWEQIDANNQQSP
jgi:hypothetical protein